MKNKHRIKQGLSLLLAGALTLSNVGAALPAFAEDAPATPETAEAVTPETAEADTTAPNLVQITENLYNDLPDAPTGSYLGSMGLPVATGETKIGISAWVSDLYDGVDAHMDADALNADENTVTIGKTPGTDYAIVPLLAQVEYPADGAVSEIILPDDVELLSYLSTDYEPILADEQEQTEILHQTYSEQSAAATGLYVKASADFTAQLVYTDSDGSSQSKSIQVQISEDAAPTQMYADTGDDGIAAYAAGPTPPYATGKITSIAKEGGTWLIWFNGQEAYCCSHGLNGQPKGCPTYSFSHVSRLEPGQYTPGNHYANQVNIWGGLGQLSLDMLDDRPVVASLEDDPEGGEEQPDILGSLYDETQQWIMENYPDSYAAQTYIAAAEELVNGTDAQSGENGYSGMSSVTLPQELIDAINNVGFWDSIPLWAVTLIGGLLITVLSFTMILTVYGRMFSLWMYAAIAPIPLSTFAGEPTSSVGKNFIRSYAGVCLQGVVIALSCIIFSAISSSPPAVDTGASVVTAVWTYVGELAFNLLVLVGAIKGCDRIVKEIMGL